MIKARKPKKKKMKIIIKSKINKQIERELEHQPFSIHIRNYVRINEIKMTKIN